MVLPHFAMPIPIFAIFLVLSHFAIQFYFLNWHSQEFETVEEKNKVKFYKQEYTNTASNVVGCILSD